MTKKPEGPREWWAAWEICDQVQQYTIESDTQYVYQSAYDQLKAENERLTIGITACAAERDALKEALETLRECSNNKFDEITRLQAKASEYESILNDILYARLGGHITTCAIGGGFDQGDAVLNRASEVLEKWRPK